MTDRELMQMALDALEEAADHIGCPDDDDAIGVTRKALRARLSQCERCGEVNPAWVGLTDEELDQAMDYWSDPSRSAYGGADRANGEYVDMKDTWRYIEEALRRKNT